MPTQDVCDTTSCWGTSRLLILCKRSESMYVRCHITATHERRYLLWHLVGHIIYCQCRIALVTRVRAFRDRCDSPGHL